MNDKDLDKAARLFRLMTARDQTDEAFERISGVSSDFAEFRVRLAMDGSLVPEAQGAVAYWMDVLRSDRSDWSLNAALHNIEQLMLKQSLLERTIGDLNGKLFEQIRQFDAMTESLSRAHQETEELRRLLARHREVLIRLGEQVELRQGNKNA